MNQEEVWDAIASKWASFRNREVLDVVDFLKGKRGKVLDLGCGSGRNFVRRDGLEFYGVDFSSRMVEIARERGYVEVLKGDVGEIFYDDEFFDYVVFNAVLHCVDSGEKRRKALREVFRVLKKGGEAFVSVWGKKGCERLGDGVKEGFVSWSVGGEKAQRYTYVYEMSELRGELERVGFEILKMEEGRNVVFVVRKS